jgi:hypothetical protein
MNKSSTKKAKYTILFLTCALLASVLVPTVWANPYAGHQEEELPSTLYTVASFAVIFLETYFILKNKSATEINGAKPKTATLPKTASVLMFLNAAIFLSVGSLTIILELTPYYGKGVFSFAFLYSNVAMICFFVFSCCLKAGFSFWKATPSKLGFLGAGCAIVFVLFFMAIIRDTVIFELGSIPLAISALALALAPPKKAAVSKPAISE